MNVRIRRLRPDDPDLADVAAALNSPEWGEEIGGFSAASLERFSQDESHIYLLAYIGEELAGAAHAYVMHHPADHVYVYIDEVDTHPAHRRRGVATALMHELFRFAAEHGAEEVWLGADEGNDPAYALYRGLRPDTEEPGAIFTYRIRGRSLE